MIIMNLNYQYARNSPYMRTKDTHQQLTSLRIKYKNKK